MAAIINLTIFIVSCIALFVSGGYLVKSLTKIASFLRLSEFVVGFIIMAFSTSIPELFVGINSAIGKNSALALGTVIGSNIADLGLVAGITILVSRKIKCEGKVLRKDSFYMILIAFIPMALMYLGNSLSRIDGAILIAIFGVYAFRMYRRRKIKSAEEKDHVSRIGIILYTLLFIGSLVALFISANYIVEYGTLLAIEIAIPAIFIGLFFVALGTSLPELVFGIRSMNTGHSGFAMGNLVGSVIVNSTLVLGVTALIFPISANFFLFFTSALFMLVICFIFATFIQGGHCLTLTEGIALIFMYILFIIVELSLSGAIPSVSLIGM
ncbi:sodium:calcium antiporter [Candidatus Woesearchaeota archaeon]|nr:sodium:calcium antiporter [Candidatus Woesearchaeota archaeon]